MSTLSTKCVDVNECLQRPGPCEHECTNSWGSYACSCPQVILNGNLAKSLQEMPKDHFDYLEIMNVPIPGVPMPAPAHR